MDDQNNEDYMIIMRKDGKYNFLTSDMKFLCEIWYDDIAQFDNFGIARVAMGAGPDKVWNYLRKDGSLILEKWVKYAGEFDHIGAITEPDNEEEPTLDPPGLLLTVRGTPRKYSYVTDGEPFAYAEYTDGKGFYVDIDGNIFEMKFSGK